uniref:ANK_REP_REGION domain-containing protein n=1 Tax=Schistosoma mansoni TaxID=6183 RepID=A0A5K4F690_SCHMA
MTVDLNRILFSEMLTTTVNRSLTCKSLKLPSTTENLQNNFKSLQLYTIINSYNSIKELWLAHELVTSEHGNMRDEETGNTLLHYLIISIPKFAKQFNDCSMINENQFYPEWASSIVGLVYRLVVCGRCSVNAQNNMGNTVLHLICLLPYTEFLAIHLIRADPEIKNNSGLHVFYHYGEQRAWLVKNLPGLNCGIWNAINREDMIKMDYYLSCWCRTIANQPNGKSLFECSMSTGNYELVKRIDQARNTNELIAAAMALDLNYMENLLSIKIEKEKCQVNKCDRSFDPPRPLTAELAIVYGNKANKAIELLKMYGAVDESSYYESVEQRKMAFINSPFYLQVKTAKTISDLNKAWKLIEYSSFQSNLRRHTDQATYLHYLVERYKSLKHQPHLQRGLIRLMAKLVISGVDLQARDKFGNTALLCAAKLNAITDKNTNSIKANESMPNQIDKEFEREDKVEDGAVLDTVVEIVEETIETVDRNVSLFNPTITDDVEHLVTDKDRNEMSSSKKIPLSMSVSNQSYKSVKNELVHSCMMNVPDFSDQRLISILIQLGSDCSIPCKNGYSVYHENYIPKGAYKIKRNIQSSLLKTSIKRSKGLIDHPGIWPIVDRLIYSVQHHKSIDTINYFCTELENTIKDNLIWLKAKRSGLTVIEWINSLWTHDRCNQWIEEIREKLTNLLQYYVSLTDFVIYSMAGDIQKLKQCLAMGKGQLKAQLHMQKFLVGINNNGRANFITRPLLVSVMEYSTAEVLQLMIQSGANLSEYYSEKEPFGPVAFWSFKNFVSLQHTYEVIKEVPVDLRDSNGSSLFHYATNLFHTIHPKDVNGFRWASLILATILKRGVKIYYRDIWERTARDILNRSRYKLMDNNNVHCETEENFRPFEEEPPDPFELHDITDPETGNLLTAEQLIDRHVAFLASANHLQSMEELILYGYNYIHLANSGPVRFKSARVLAEQKGHHEMISLLDTVDQYRTEMMEVHKTIITGDYHQFLRLVNNKRVIMSRDWRERSLLHLAVLYRRTDFVLQLIELCQELVNYQDCLGRTPFHYAICLPDNRRLFLKIVSKSGGIDKQIKDLRNISIHQYGELYDRKIPEYQNLIHIEKSIKLLESNWPDQTICSSSLKIPNDNDDQLSIKDKDEPDNEQSIIEVIHNTTTKNTENCLIFPIPGAFNAFEVKRIKSIFNWKQRM